MVFQKEKGGPSSTVVQSFASVFKDVCMKWPSEQFSWAAVLRGFQILHLYKGEKQNWILNQHFCQEQQKSSPARNSSQSSTCQDRNVLTYSWWCGSWEYKQAEEIQASARKICQNIRKTMDFCSNVSLQGFESPRARNLLTLPDSPFLGTISWDNLQMVGLVA